MTNHRKEIVAGTFYSANPSTLQKDVSRFVTWSKKKSKKPVQFIIVPHAGYAYSGAIAGESYAEIAQTHYKRIILLGPSHRFSFDGIAESGSDYWDSPIGNMKVDPAETKEIKVQPQYHKSEHSLEVQIPFLTNLKPDTPITPLLVSGSLNQADRFAQILTPLLDKDTLWVISSDFNHTGPYFGHLPESHGYSSGEDMDREAIEIICSGSKESFRTFLKQTSATICGALPILIAMNLIKQTGVGSFQFKKYDCSGKQTGDINSVGYGSLFI